MLLHNKHLSGKSVITDLINQSFSKVESVSFVGGTGLKIPVRFTKVSVVPIFFILTSTPISRR